MSRSYKKKSIIKNKPTFGKKLGNRKFRRKSKAKLKSGKTEELPLKKREIINDYDVCDWKFLITQKTDDLYVKFGHKPLRKGKKKKINK